MVNEHSDGEFGVAGEIGDGFELESPSWLSVHCERMSSRELVVEV